MASEYLDGLRWPRRGPRRPQGASDSLRELQRASGSLKKHKRDFCRAEKSLEDLKRLSKGTTFIQSHV